MRPKHFNYSVVKNVESVDKPHSGGDSVYNKLTHEETTQPKYSREQEPVSCRMADNGVLYISSHPSARRRM